MNPFPPLSNRSVHILSPAQFTHSPVRCSNVCADSLAPPLWRQRTLWVALVLALVLSSLPLYRAGAVPASQASPQPDTTNPDTINPDALNSGQQLFLPYVAMSSCQPNADEATLASHLASDPQQRRDGVRCSARLARVARDRALDMATRGYFGHETPEGIGPNDQARAAGCELPDIYPDGVANSIESIAAGYADANEAWDALMDSPSHRLHLLAEHDFYRDQTDYGVGYAYAPDSPYIHYWVVLTAECQ